MTDDQTTHTGPQQPSLPAEHHRERRGHDFYPPPQALAAIPALYATENVPPADKIVHLHYFASNADWYITELDPNSGIAFGWAQLAEGEWGNVSLPELEEVNSGLIIVERDLYFQPTRVGDIPGIGR